MAASLRGATEMTRPAPSCAVVVSDCSAASVGSGQHGGRRVHDGERAFLEPLDGVAHATPAPDHVGIEQDHRIEILAAAQRLQLAAAGKSVLVTAAEFADVGVVDRDGLLERAQERVGIERRDVGLGGQDQQARAVEHVGVRQIALRHEGRQRHVEKVAHIVVAPSYEGE